jgi:uncharacterized protein (DUF433 family)
MMNIEYPIVIDPAIRSDKPVVKGTRIARYDVLELLATGMSWDQVIEHFPDMAREDVQACVAFVAERERRIVRLAA